MKYTTNPISLLPNILHLLLQPRPQVRTQLLVFRFGLHSSESCPGNQELEGESDPWVSVVLNQEETEQGGEEKRRKREDKETYISVVFHRFLRRTRPQLSQRTVMRLIAYQSL